MNITEQNDNFLNNFHPKKLFNSYTETMYIVDERERSNKKIRAMSNRDLTTINRNFGDGFTKYLHRPNKIRWLSNTKKDEP